MRASRSAASLALGCVALGCVLSLASFAPAWAQAPTLTDKTPAPFKPDADQVPDTPDDTSETSTDTWIFSGALNDSHETFSGTLVTGKTGAQFELKLASGATCDGGDLKPGTGLVRLSDITCSDDRVLRALFVPQSGQELKVFGHVGDERFATLAHILGTQPIPEKPQTAEPKAPTPEPPPPASTPSRPDPG